MQVTMGAEDIWTELGAEDDDLSEVLRHVRVSRLPATQRLWANSWQTRQFLNLGLRLLHEHHSQRGGQSGDRGEGIRLSTTLTPENLANKAQLVIADRVRADALGVVRWKETWGHQAAYTDDLIAYLFRPAPYLRRVEQVQGALYSSMIGLPLAELIRQGAAAEMASCLADPLIALQTLVQAALPYHATISRHATQLEDVALEVWARLYAELFPAYGLSLRLGLTWLDVAQLFATAIEGTLLRTRIRGREPALDGGDPMLAGSILALLPGLFDIPVGEIAGRLPASA
jgi:hypothetical protein